MPATSQTPGRAFGRPADASQPNMHQPNMQWHDFSRDDSRNVDANTAELRRRILAVRPAAPTMVGSLLMRRGSSTKNYVCCRPQHRDSPRHIV
jgi:hypothetical protein